MNRVFTTLEEEEIYQLTQLIKFSVKAHVLSWLTCNKLFDKHGIDAMTKAFERLDDAQTSSLINQCGEYLLEKYAGRDMPENILKNIPSIEHQEHDLYL